MNHPGILLKMQILIQQVGPGFQISDKLCGDDHAESWFSTLPVHQIHKGALKYILGQTQESIVIGLQ